MVLQWHEHEQEYVDRVIQGDMAAQQALRACGLYKFCHLGRLIANPRLLQMLMGYWDLDTNTF